MQATAKEEDPPASIVLGLYWDYIGIILGLCRVIYRDNGKENGNYYRV